MAPGGPICSLRLWLSRNAAADTQSERTLTNTAIIWPMGPSPVAMGTLSAWMLSETRLQLSGGSTTQKMCSGFPLKTGGAQTWKPWSGAVTFTTLLGRTGTHAPLTFTS
jgi:hypothetical protein